MPALEQKNFQKRGIAYKVSVSDILENTFIKDDESAGYINVGSLAISRVNLIATVVYKSESVNYSSMIVDDGTGKILLRSFEPANLFSKVDVGDAVLVIGKIREFNNDKYVMPEILKRLSSFGWINLRKIEMRNADFSKINAKGNQVVESPNAANPNEEIYLLIKKLDTGDGISIDDVIKSSSNKDAENIINRMLENGDIFEIKPGKLKVLE